MKPAQPVVLDRALVPSALVLAGLLVAVGALLHPHVIGTTAAEKVIIRTSRLWVPSHVLLTLGQALAAAVVPVALGALPSPRTRAGRTSLTTGTYALTIGLVIGALGTLTAATALAAASRAPGADPGGVFHVANAGALGLGWLMLVLTSLGGVLVAVPLVHASNLRVRALALLALGGGSVFLVAAVATAFPFVAGWLHAYVLRPGAFFLGVALILAAAATAHAAPPR